MGKHLGRARWRGVAIAVATLAICFGAGIGPAAADDDDSPYKTLVDGEVTRQEEAASLAEKYGLTEAVAIDWYDDNKAAGSVVAAVKSREDEFTGPYYTKDDGRYILHVVRAAGHEEATVELPAFNVLEVVYEDQRYTPR